jgi:hypothetical protein
MCPIDSSILRCPAPDVEIGLTWDSVAGSLATTRSPAVTDSFNTLNAWPSGSRDELMLSIIRPIPIPPIPPTDPSFSMVSNARLLRKTASPGWAWPASNSTSRRSPGARKASFTVSGRSISPPSVPTTVKLSGVLPLTKARR